MSVLESPFELSVLVGASAVDANGHVNNVEYIRWMQDAAAQHSDHVGCTLETTRLGATWVVRSHHIEYLRPAHEGETLLIQTWISNAHRVRSMREYRFVRAADDREIATARTEWILLDVASGRPRAIPEDIIDLFGVTAREKR